MSPLELGFLRLSSGLRLRFRCLGDDGPAVLLLHGWPQTGHAWRRVMPTLAASGYRVVVPDLRGAGDSDKPTEGYDARTRMEDVRELVSALGLGDAPVLAVGHGEGADVAAAYAADHPGEVAGLATLSAGPGVTPAGWHGGFHQTPDLPELLLAPHLEAYLRHFFRAWSHDPDMLPEQDLAVYIRALSQPGALRASLAPFRASQPPTPDPDPRVPRLLLLGESDPRLGTRNPDSPEAAAAGERQGGTVRIETIPRGGYWLPEERPDPVAAALLTFFREHGPGSHP